MCGQDLSEQCRQLWILCAMLIKNFLASVFLFGLFVVSFEGQQIFLCDSAQEVCIFYKWGVPFALHFSDVIDGMTPDNVMAVKQEVWM